MARAGVAELSATQPEDLAQRCALVLGGQDARFTDGRRDEVKALATYVGLKPPPGTWPKDIAIAAIRARCELVTSAEKAAGGGAAGDAASDAATAGKRSRRPPAKVRADDQSNDGGREEDQEEEEEEGGGSKKKKAAPKKAAAASKGKKKAGDDEEDLVVTPKDALGNKQYPKGVVACANCHWPVTLHVNGAGTDSQCPFEQCAYPHAQCPIPYKKERAEEHPEMASSSSAGGASAGGGSGGSSADTSESYAVLREKRLMREAEARIAKVEADKAIRLEVARAAVDKEAAKGTAAVQAIQARAATAQQTLTVKNQGSIDLKRQQGQLKSEMQEAKRADRMGMLGNMGGLAAPFGGGSGVTGQHQSLVSALAARAPPHPYAAAAAAAPLMQTFQSPPPGGSAAAGAVPKDPFSASAVPKDPFSPSSDDEAPWQAHREQFEPLWLKHAVVNGSSSVMYPAGFVAAMSEAQRTFGVESAKMSTIFKAHRSAEPLAFKTFMACLMEVKNAAVKNAAA